MNKSILQYIQSVPSTRSEKFNSIHSLILSLYPHAEVELSYKMPTYKVGKGWVALANQKQYISLYTCGYHHIEAFKENNPGIKTGKGCINFRDKDELHMDDIEQVIRHAIEHPKPGE